MLSAAQSGLAEWQQRSSVPPLHTKRCSEVVCVLGQGHSRTVTACCARSPGPLKEKILLWDIMDTVVKDPFYAKVPEFFNMSLKELYSVKHPTAWVDFEKGEINEDVLVRKFFRDGRAFDSEGMKHMMLEACQYMEGMQQLLQELADRGLQMHAMSNYPVWYRAMNEKLHIDRYLQGWTFMSCEGPMKGLRKPDQRCWEVAQRHLGAEASQLVLIDDRQENCDSAAEAGLHAIHSTDADSTRRRLIELSVF